MSILKKIRIYHASLAVTAILAYLTGEFGVIHSWLGYGVAAIIVFRLLWALGGNKQLGLSKFHPNFDGLAVTNIFTHPAVSKTLLLGIALSLILATATGIAMDKGKDIGLANATLVAQAYADDDKEEEGEDENESIMSEAHEFFSNLMLLSVFAHASYLLLFRTPLAKFMLFIKNPANKGS
jgi:cytochrome b